mmetsp:Transcript_52627/g.53014  ORF Transcript_52627/g.53014 Transcript_52627/m.53014 type:complete len:97 (+) Transcript_52627:282-572(+)
MNSRFDIANRVGVLGFIAMDEHEGGRVAGEDFLRDNRNIGLALFVYHNKGNNAMDQRFHGFSEGLNMMQLPNPFHLPYNHSTTMQFYWEGARHRKK